jgi:hypothetical protein
VFLGLAIFIALESKTEELKQTATLIASSLLGNNPESKTEELKCHNRSEGYQSVFNVWI